MAGIYEVKDQRESVYYVYHGMLQRCYNPKSTSYEYYGAKGVTVSDRWQGKDGFINFFNDMGPRPDKRHSIDRIDPDGNYEPSNCRWATKIQQVYSRRKVKAAEHVGVAYSKLYGHWNAYMVVDGLKVLNGYYLTKEQAIEARKHAESVWLDGYSTYDK